VNVSQPASIYTCPAGFTGSGSGAALTCSKTVAIDPLITCKAGVAPQSAGAGDYVCIIGNATTGVASVPFCAKGSLNSDKTKCLLTTGHSGGSSIAPKFTG